MTNPSIDPRKMILALIGVAGIAVSAACSTQRAGADEAACQSACTAKGDDHDDGESETRISISDLPAAVRTALGGLTAEDKVLQVTRDVEDGKTSYDVEYSKNGARWAAEFSPTGQVLENEADIEDDDDGDDE